MDTDKILKGLKLIRTSLILLIVISFLNIPVEILSSIIMRSFDNWSAFLALSCTMSMISLGSFIVLIISIVFLGIGIHTLRKNADEIDEDHKKNMNWSWKLFWVYVATIVASFLISFLFGMFISFDLQSMFLRISIFTFISQTIRWLSTISIILVLVLPIKSIADGKQKDLAYLYAGGSLALGFLLSLLTTIAYISSIEFLWAFLNNIFVAIVRSLIFVGLSISIYLAYKQTIDIMIEPEKLDRSRKRLFKKPLPFQMRFNKGLSRPISLVIIFVVIGMILGAGSGIGSYLSNVGLFDDGGGGGDIIIVLDPDSTVETISQVGTLAEGEMEEIEVFLEGVLVHDIQVTLIWRDEPNVRRYENTPDRFTLETSVVTEMEGEWDQDETGENDMGGEGELNIQYTADENDPFQIISFMILITLDDAGDYYPRLGPGIIIMTDTQNDYDLIVTVEYYEGEEVTNQ